MSAVIVLYGLLTNFVILSASRNRKAAVPNPPILEYVGQGLFGLTVGMLVMLVGCIVTGADFPIDQI